MSYVEHKARLESDLDEINSKIERLLEEISSLEDKKTEVEDLKKEMVSLRSRAVMIDEIYEEGKQAAEMPKEMVKEVIDGLKVSHTPEDFQEAESVLGIEEAEEETEPPLITSIA